MQRHAIVLCVGLTLVSGCVPDAPNDDPIYTSGGANIGEETLGPDGSGGETDGDDLGDGLGDGDGDGDGGRDSGDGDGDGSCVSVSEQAELSAVPADIIFIVDNSGSMGEETGFVQDQLNGFSAQIQQSGVDAHVILISAFPEEGHGICVEPPLGNGGCPYTDEQLPTYRHVDHYVGSHDALSLLLAMYPAWQGTLRPEATKHVVVVTDDDAGLQADVFDGEFEALDPSLEQYVMHGIVCPWQCVAAASVGSVYMQLIQHTGGVLGDLCAQDFQPVFDELASAVIEGVPLACHLEIPAPPMGMELDPDLVNVELGDGNGNVQDIPRVADAQACDLHPDGWYYDDPLAPTQIVLCPQTCATAQSNPQAQINVAFGCESFVVE